MPKSKVAEEEQENKVVKGKVSGQRRKKNEVA